MSRLIKLLVVLIFGLFFTGFLLLGQVGCSQPQQQAAQNLLGAISEGVDTTLEEPEQLVFAGQVSAGNGRWANGYVAVLFKNGVEIARTNTGLVDAPLSGAGPMDGVFELRIRNEYKLKQTHAFFDANAQPISMQSVMGMVGMQYIGTWFANLNPNSIRTISIPEKQLVYTLVILEMPLDQLPESYQSGNLSLNGELLVTSASATSGNENVALQATPAPQPTPQSNFQLLLLPSQNGGQDWHLQLTGYYGNRWDVWERFVAGKGHSMSWETFKEAVLVHNPQLKSDGFVFYPHKAYLLPTTN